jgi:hypothetical protein
MPRSSSRISTLIASFPRGRSLTCIDPLLMYS